MEVAPFLKEKTARYHEQVEAAACSVQIMDRTLTYEQYRNLIRAHWLFYKSLPDKLTLIGPRWKEIVLRFIQSLEMDKKSLDIHGRAPRSSEEPTYSFAAQMGILYVVLGSTNGGKVIYNRLKENQHLKDVPSFSFYQEMQAFSTTEWRVFLKEMNQSLHSQKECNEALEGATYAFTYLTEKLETRW
jgi:heme oxygenase